MDRTQEVLTRLKPKAKALGFNAKELKGIAARVADNLLSAEDALEEDVNVEIDKAIDAVLPYLSFGQSQANRVLDEWKKNHPETDEEEEDPRQAGSTNKNPKDKGSETPEWAKGLLKTVETLTGKITALEGERTTSSRRSKLEALLKDSGTFGTRQLKNFGKMDFKDEDEFNEWLSDVEADLKAYNQERADLGLSAMGTPPGAGKGKQKEDVLLTEAEIKAIAENL